MAKKKFNNALGSPDEAGTFDSLKAEEIDFGSILIFQLNDIRKFDNEGDWDGYSNSVEQLEKLLFGYINENSVPANEYRKKITDTLKSYKVRLGTPPKRLDYKRDQRRWGETCEKEFMNTKHKALLVFMTKKNFLPRQTLG
jgi:hypothetical protein